MLRQVRMTQRAIKQVLTERYYSWRDAEIISKEDPEINPSGEGPTYVPRDFVEEHLPDEVEQIEAAEEEQKAVRPEPTADGTPGARLNA
jgi:large subunit ribosomal protein L47